MGDIAQRHRPCGRPRAGPHPAGHDHRLRRQPHLDPRRLRGPGPRHRHLARSSTCWPPRPCASSKSKNMRVTLRRRAGPRRRRQGLRPGPDRRDRHGRRHRLRHRIRRRGDPGALDGRAHDALQPDHRGAARAPAWSRRTRPPSPICRAARPRPRAAAWEMALAYWKSFFSDPDARFDREIAIDVARRSRPRSPGAPAPRTWSRSTGRVPDPADFDERQGRRRSAARWTTWASSAGQPIAEARIDGCSSAPAPTAASRTCAPPPTIVEGRKVADHVRAMVVPGSGLVRDQAEAEGLDAIFLRRRLRLARAGLLDVPGHEPRQAGARRALRLDLQPQLRGPPGPRRPHPPDEPGHGRRRRHRRPHRRRAGLSCASIAASTTSPIAVARPRRRRRRLSPPAGPRAGAGAAATAARATPGSSSPTWRWT